jgi:uncharacterized cupredoxin-like copper-binding protein
MRKTPALGLLAAALLLGLAAANAAGPVEVKLSEYSIDMPHTVPAGATTFKVSNQGGKVHIFKLQGPGIPEEGRSVSVPPHSAGSLDVTLEAGDYKVYCPIGSHAIKGMTLTLKVTPKPS